MRLVIAALAAALLAPSPSLAAGRLTSTGSDDGGVRKKKAGGRKHATPIDGDSQPEDEAPPAKKKPLPADDDDGPPAKPAGVKAAPTPKVIEVQPVRGKRGSSDEDDDEDGVKRSERPREDAPPRHTRTAEEDSYQSPDDETLSGLDEPGSGANVVVSTGLALLDAAVGVDGRFTIGLGGYYQLGRILFPPENDILHRGLFLDAGWMATAKSGGTDSVKASTSFHFLHLSVMAGYPFGEHLLAYLKLGPAMVIQPLSYDVQGTMTGYTGVRAGILYGIGAHAVFWVNEKVGIAGRFEIIRYRRAYLNDTMLIAGIGASL